MSVHDELFAVGRRHHDAALALLSDLEEVQTAHPDEQQPREALRIRAAIWEWSQAYGRRDEHGAVDMDPDPEIKAWRPGDDEAGQ